MSKTVQFHILNTLSQALTEVFETGKHADRMIDKYMRVNKNWSSDDRSFFAESVYSIVRHKRNLEFIAESENLWEVIAAYLVTQNLVPVTKGHRNTFRIKTIYFESLNRLDNNFI